MYKKYRSVLYKLITVITLIVMMCGLSFPFGAQLVYAYDYPGETSPSTRFFVASDGSDSNNGLTESTPFATVQKARDTIRTLTNKNQNVYVYIKAGEYYQDSAISFNETDSWTDGYKVYYKKNPNYTGEVRVIGGQKVTGWQQVTGSSIYKTNVGTDNKFYSLFENGERAVMAKSPNTGYFSVESVDNGKSSAFGIIQAEWFSSSQATVYVNSLSENRKIIEGFGWDNSRAEYQWVCYKNMDFGNAGASKIRAYISKGLLNSVDREVDIDIRLDSLNGPLAGTIENLPNTGWGTYTMVEANLNGAVGNHDVYLIPRTTGTDKAYLCHIDWFDFVPQPSHNIYEWRIQAESYDEKSGQYISPYSYDSTGSMFLSLICNDDYLLFKNFDFTSNGPAYFEVNLAGIYSGQSIELRIDSPTGTRIGTMSVPETGGWSLFQRGHCELETVTGAHDLYLVFKGKTASEGGGVCNIDWFRFQPASERMVEAEGYSGKYGTNIASYTENNITGMNGFQENNYLYFNDINLGLLGASRFEAHVKMDYQEGASIEIRLDSPGGNLAGTASITQTYGNYAVYGCDLSSVSGVHNIYLVFKGTNIGYLKINQFKIFSAAPNLYGKIEGESWSAKQGTYIQNYNDPNSSGTIAQYMGDGNYLKYSSIDFRSGGISSFQVMASVSPSNFNNNRIEVHADSASGTLLGTLNLNLTNGWGLYQVQSCNLDSIDIRGVHDIYLVFRGDSVAVCNLDWFRFSPAADSLYYKVEGENYTGTNGTIVPFTYSDGSATVMAGIYPDDWVRYSNFDFGTTGEGTFRANVGVIDDRKGAVEIRLGSATGTLVGKLELNGTGGLNNYSVQSCEIKGISGKHDVYLIFKDTQGYICNFDWFAFKPNYGEFANIKIEAESGIGVGTAVSAGGTGTVVTSADNNDYLQFSNIDFTNKNIAKFKAGISVPLSNANQQVEIWLDNLSTGTKIGTMTVKSTGSWDNFLEEGCLVNANNVTGVHDVFLKFVGTQNGICNLDWFSFEAWGPDDRYITKEAESFDASNPTGKSGVSGGTGYVVEQLEDNNWLKFSNTNFGTVGANRFIAGVSSLPGDAYYKPSIEIRLDSPTGTLVGTASVGDTGGREIYSTISCKIAKVTGTHDVYLIFKTSNSSFKVCNIDWFSFVQVTDNIFDRFEAENDTSSSGVAESSGGSGVVLNSANADGYVCYKYMDFGSAGADSFLASLAVDPQYDGRQVELRLDSTTGTSIGTLTLKSTGSSSNYEIQSCRISGTRGVHDLYLVFKGANGTVYNMDYFIFRKILREDEVKRIEAEQYNTMSGVEVANGATGKIVQSIHNGDWICYKGVDLGDYASKEINLKFSHGDDNIKPGDSMTVEVRLDSPTGHEVSRIYIFSSSDWDNYITSFMGNFKIPARGVHDLYFIFRGPAGGTPQPEVCRLDWIYIGPSKYHKNIYLHPSDYQNDFEYSNIQMAACTAQGGATGISGNFYTEFKPVMKVDNISNKITLYPGPDIYDSGYIGSNQRIYLQGSMDFLDTAGEYYLDEFTGWLYYWPKNTANLTAKVIAPKTKRVIELKGSSESQLVKNLQFEGLTLEISDFDNSFSKSLIALYGGEHYVDKDGLVYMENASDNTIKYCKIVNAGYSGVMLSKYCQDNIITGNWIEKAGNHGVMLSGWNLGDGGYTSLSTAHVNKNNTVKNNRILDCGKYTIGGCGVYLYQSGDNEISYNEISDMPRSGIMLEAPWPNGYVSFYGTQYVWSSNLQDFRFTRNNSVKYNDVYSVMKDSEDCGGIYGRALGSDNIIESNRVHDITCGLDGTGSADDPATSVRVGGYLAGIYIDDTSGYTTVRKNIIYGIDGSYADPVMIKGSHSIFENNVTVNNPGLTYTSKIDSHFNSSGIFIDNLTVTKNIFDRNQGEFIYKFNGFTENDWSTAVINYNVFYHPNGTYLTRGAPTNQTSSDGTWSEWLAFRNNQFDQQSITAQDPLFENRSINDYRVKANSPALGTGIGFTNIDQANIGLKTTHYDGAFPFRRASDIIQGEKYFDDSYGTVNTGVNLESIDDGQILRYVNVDFGDVGASYFKIKAAVGNDENQTVEIWKDSCETQWGGVKIGTLDFSATLDMDTYSIQSAAITQTSGVHDIYLIFKKGTQQGNRNTDLCSLDWLTFSNTP